MTLFGLYFFRIHSQGVVALVSVSEGKTQITILILRRGTCLVNPPPLSGNARIEKFFFVLMSSLRCFILHPTWGSIPIPIPSICSPTELHPSLTFYSNTFQGCNMFRRQFRILKSWFDPPSIFHLPFLSSPLFSHFLFV